MREERGWIACNPAKCLTDPFGFDTVRTDILFPERQTDGSETSETNEA
jgi:hypothetical protein